MADIRTTLAAEGLDNASMLVEVKKAIRTVMIGGQSYKIGSRSLTRANLAELRAAEADISEQIAEDENAHLLGNTSVAFFEGR